MAYFTGRQRRGGLNVWRQLGWSWRTSNSYPAERPLPDARGTVAGCSEGNKNAFKHGRYSARHIQERRQVSALIRALSNEIQ